MSLFRVKYLSFFLKKKYKMNIKGIIHIGAHFGQEIPDYIDCGIQDMVMFEPLEENFKVLAEKAKGLNANIVGHQVALGPEPGKTKMYVSDHNRISSSILKPKVHLTHHPNVKFPETEEVEVNCLDNCDVNIEMSLTAPACPVAGELPKEVCEKVSSIDNVGEVAVKLVWDPAWTKDMMSDAAKLNLRLLWILARI